LLNDYFAEFKNVAKDQKKEFGQAINQLKTTAQDKVNTLKAELDNTTQKTGAYGDLSRPGEPVTIGARHPISLVKNQIIDIFSNIGFNVSEGAGYLFYSNQSRYFITYSHQFCSSALYGK